jgi:hypothetical protein
MAAVTTKTAEAKSSASDDPRLVVDIFLLKEAKKHIIRQLQELKRAALVSPPASSLSMPSNIHAIVEVWANTIQGMTQYPKEVEEYVVYWMRQVTVPSVFVAAPI